LTRDQRSLAEAVLELCRAHGWTLATAESCTGGLVGARLTEVPGASDVYVGGVVAYSDDVKRSHLDVPDETLQEHGAVSAETAAAMAAGARRALNADVAVAVTGIAGPSGGTPEKPVGLVFIAARSPDGNFVETVQLNGDRDAIRDEATEDALRFLHRVLTQSAKNTHDRAR
jgi:nicotinamide-nucleotide amidase